MADVGGQLAGGMGKGAGGIVQVLAIPEFWVSIGIALLTLIGAIDMMILTHTLPVHFSIYNLESIRYYLKFSNIFNPIIIGILLCIIILIFVFITERTHWIMSKIIFPFIAVLTFGIFIIGTTAVTLTFYPILIIIIIAIIYVIFIIRTYYPVDTFLTWFAVLLLIIPILYVILRGLKYL